MVYFSFFHIQTTHFILMTYCIGGDAFIDASKSDWCAEISKFTYTLSLFFTSSYDLGHVLVAEILSSNSKVSWAKPELQYGSTQWNLYRSKTRHDDWAKHSSCAGLISIICSIIRSAAISTTRKSAGRRFVRRRSLVCWSSSFEGTSSKKCNWGVLGVLSNGTECLSHLPRKKEKWWEGRVCSCCFCNDSGIIETSHGPITQDLSAQRALNMALNWALKLALNSDSGFFQVNSQFEFLISGQSNLFLTHPGFLSNPLELENFSFLV